MNIARASLWNGIAVAVRMFTALVLNKILAIYVGPAGYAVIGQFQNTMSVAITFATGAINSGVTKITAEHFDDEVRQRALWRTAGTVVIGASLISASLAIVFRELLAREMLKDASLSGVFVWFAISLTFVSLNALLLSIFNGKKDIHRYVISNIAGSFLALGVVGILTWSYGLYGALIALSVYQGVAFFFTLYLSLRAPWFRLYYLFGRIDLGHLKNLGHFMVMAATTAVVVPLSLVLVRRHLGAEFGWEYAGYWDAMWRISTIYLTLVTATLSVYYLPRIAEIREWKVLRAEIIQAYKIVLPIVIASALAMFLLRDLIIRLLFTPEFAPMRQLFALQLTGDVLKIASWLIAYLMVGKSMTRTFVATEIGFALLFWLLTVSLSPFLGFRAVAAAYLINYALYGVVVYLLILSTPERRAALFQ